jgi:signal peptidase II
VAALRLGLALAAAVAVADQLVKWWAIPALSATPGGIEVLPFFNLVMVWNRGVSFGLLGGAALPPLLLAGFAGLVAVGLAVWLARVDGRWPVVGIGLIIGGAVGNIVDRLLHGAVADFFDFHVGAYHWPAFNVADAAISVGLAALVIDSLLIRREGRK